MDLKQKFFIFILLFSVFAQFGCVPKDMKLDSATLASIIAGQKPDEKNFTGLTSVQTDSATSLQLNWNASSNSLVVGYRIYDTTLLFDPRIVDAAPLKSVTKKMSGLRTGVYYSWRVRALFSDGTEDDNVIDIGGIPYGGIVSADVQSSTSALITFNDASNADKVKIYCKVGLTAITEDLMATVVATSNTTTVALTSLLPGETYDCRAVAVVGEFEDNNTQRISFIPLGQASQLNFKIGFQPSSSTAGDIWATQPVVEIKDSGGNLITAGPDANATITLSISSVSPTLGSVRGTATVTAVKGVATFAGLSIQEAGEKILTATKSDTSNKENGSGPLTVDSSSFAISAGTISILNSAITINPEVPPATALVADGNNAYEVKIKLADQFGNPKVNETTEFSSSILAETGLTFITQPGKTGADGVAIGSFVTTIADEVAPFRSLYISSPAGLNTLKTLAPFLPGAAKKLAFLVQPQGPMGAGTMYYGIKVAVQDAKGNIVNAGPGSNATITLSINQNDKLAVLSGTTSAQAINGVATFDIAIDKIATGYNLLANSVDYGSVLSSAFSVEAGNISKFVIAGATSVISGSCSQAITIEAQDAGGNPKAVGSNTSLYVSGLGGASLYVSPACSGTPVQSAVGTNLNPGENLQVTLGMNKSKLTYYLKDPVGEGLSLSVNNRGAWSSASRSIQVIPNKIGLAAYMPTPPAATGTVMSVVSGVCSPPIYITPAGDNGNAAPLFNLTPVAVTGLMGSGAQLYSDENCTVSLTASNFSLPVTAGTGSNRVAIYLKDDKAESLTMSVTDPSAVMSTVSSPQLVNILPSKIDFTGPTSVVAGKCSTVFTITLKDAAGNAVNALAPTTLKINGLQGSSTGKFYASAACSGTSYTSTVQIPQNNSSITLYFSDTNAEALNISMSDPLALMTNSPTISIGISPAGLKITGPNPANSKTTICAGPFTVNTMDGAVVPNITAAISPINVKLAHSGYPTGFETAGVFYSDLGCTSVITNLTFDTGISAQKFYFMGQYPRNTLTFTASDVATVLTSGSTTWKVIAARSWIGTMGADLLDSLGNLLSWFKTGVKPVAARMDAPSSAKFLRFDSLKKFLYVVDENSHRILKYDYPNKRFVGWIGGFTNPNNAASFVRSSTQSFYPSVPSVPVCKATINGQTTPGWCLGGQSLSSVTATSGVMYSPRSLAVDDNLNYIYVVNYNSGTVTRYVADSGAFAGWIGGIYSAPTGAAPGGPGTCSTTSSGPTPGWCMGGANLSSGGWGNTNGANAISNGDGSFNYPRSITTDGTYLYVGVYGAVLKFLAIDGSFQGWIGKVANGGAGSTPTSDGCTALAVNTTTPGWCKGGRFVPVSPNFKGGTGNLAGGIAHPTDLYIKNGVLYVLDTDSGGTISTYDLNSGAFIKILTPASNNWMGAYAITEVPDFQTPGQTNFAIADNARVITVHPVTSTVIGWLGKVSNSNGLTPALQNLTDCSTLVPNANTPGWCLGGTAKAGLDEQAIADAQGIEYDGNGNILVGQWRNPSIKIFDASTGAYGGSLVYSSMNLQSWSNDATTDAEYYGFGDGDFFGPRGLYSDKTYLYVSDGDNGRIKKISLASGATVGWVGAITTVPTGGPPDMSAACLNATPMSVTPGWCLGAVPNLRSTTNIIGNPDALSGSLYVPHGIAGDGVYIYVVDNPAHRIHRYRADTGAYGGWIGAVNNITGMSCPSTPTVGAFTPGWCTGGISQAGSGDGMLNYPSAITYLAGSLYVIDSNNQRVSSYDANTGLFKGWIGRIGTPAPSSGCITASNQVYTVSVSGWCKGGAAALATNADRGGGFSFWGGNAPGGITTDGTDLYIANYNLQRIDRYSTGGVLKGSLNPRFDTNANTWVAAPSAAPYGMPSTVSGGWGPMGIYADSSYLYVMLNYYTSVVVKINLATGSVVGWQGGILPSSQITGGDPGCVGGTISTAGWCLGGTPMQGFRLGQFYGAYYITGDDNYIYISDVNTHRVTRIPK